MNIASAATGNEVAIETIEAINSPLKVGKLMLGKGVGCSFINDSGIVTTYYMTPKRGDFIILDTEPGERCVVNTKNETVLSIFLSTSMATPSVVK